MKKRILLSAQILLFGLLFFSLLATTLQFFGKSNPLTRFDYPNMWVYNKVEAYDPALIRLNSLKKFEEYCDSIYKENIAHEAPVEFEKIYTDIVSTAVRNRFYHGYSYLGLNNNYFAFLISKVTMKGYSAPVIPDDILRFPYAACSQQAIVMMGLLNDKGIKTRKISFLGKSFGGHFAFEVFYDNAWHFHDPNMEPDKKVLNDYNRPGIEFLARNPEILVHAYNRLPREEVLDLFPSYSVGPVNKFPAPRALIFQKTTAFLSNTGWLFFLFAFILVRRRYLRIVGKMKPKRGRRSIFLGQSEATSIFYPDYTRARGA